MNIDKTVALLMGGSSLEREISLKTGKAVGKALNSIGFNTVQIDIRDNLNKLLSEEYDSAFIALHGCHGEDGSIQGMLEIIGLPYTGSGVLASAATMDKAFSKMVMIANGIKTPEFQKFKSIADARAFHLQGNINFNNNLFLEALSDYITAADFYIKSEDYLNMSLILDNIEYCISKKIKYRPGTGRQCCTNHSNGCRWFFCIPWFSGIVFNVISRLPGNREPLN